MHNKEGQSLNAKHLVSWGFKVVVPNLNYSLFTPNPEKREVDIIGLIDEIEQISQQSGSVFSDVDLAQVGISGHSAGGLTAIMVTAHDSRIKALVGLDAVLTGGMPGSQEFSWDPREEGHLITQPSSFLLAPPQSCNNDQDGGVITYDYIASDYKAKYQLVNGSHCDFMDASEFPNSLCFSLCGGDYDELRCLLSRKYLTAWMMFFLQDRNEVFDYLFGEKLQADIEANYLENVDYQFPGEPTLTSTPAQPTVTPSPGCLEGDANNDGQISLADLVFLLSNYLQPARSQCSDQQKDEFLNLLDYGLVLLKL
jgi:hypothetical protein